MATEGGFTVHLSSHVAEVGSSQKEFDRRAVLTTPHPPHEHPVKPVKSPKSSSVRVAPKRMTGERWGGHPAQAVALRVFAMAVPIVAAVLSSIVFSRVVPYPKGAAVVALWWIAVFAVSTIVLRIVDHWARRLLPLAALLKLSMAFPDHAPSRFGVALKSGTVKNLEERIEQVRLHGVDDEPSRAARQILELIGMLNAHDPRSRGHSERVRAFTDLLAAELKLSQEDRDRLHWAALLHDVGKVMVPHEILNKQGAPDEHEWERLHRHPEDGDRLAAPLRPWLGQWADTIVQHHEKWDGSGYPNHLAGENISLGARIVAVADAFEVMTATRSYKESIDVKAAREELIKCSGSHFDPAMVRAFLNVSLGKLRWTAGPLAWLAQLPFLQGIPTGLPTQIAVAGGRTLAGVAVFAGVSTPTYVPPKPEPKATYAAAIPTAPGATVPTATPQKKAPTSSASSGSQGAPATAATPETTAAPLHLVAGNEPLPASAVTPTTTATTVPNKPPVAHDDAVFTPYQTPKSVDVTANDSDPEGHLTYPITILDHSAAINVGVKSDGHSVNVSPNNAPPGTYGFRYQVCDNQGACDSAFVTVTVGVHHDDH